ncbi:hypothetical protein HPP92_016302 [Vanilla planifolia]|uniref:Protein kinase domain-containing protein n=1 Tax=Vanilla planifolia TaxID=51239 RepID=A0A835QKY1_VANPL|nr:hypothetical protein HPP92_016302 [Vanilla planifolia]
MFLFGNKRRSRQLKKRRSHGGRGWKRRNAVKNIDYEASWASSSSDESPSMRTTRSWTSPGRGTRRTSFRIEGSIDGEVDRLCRRIGLSGPEAFSHRTLSAQDPAPASDRLEETGDCAAVPIEESRVRTAAVETVLCEEVLTREEKMLNIPRSSPGMMTLATEDLGVPGLLFSFHRNLYLRVAPISDAVRFFAPTEKNDAVDRRKSLDSDDEESDGIFIAIKEVSLLDRGSSAQQCIDQLEHEIALLSQFEHENIVRYYGTDKNSE